MHRVLSYGVRLSQDENFFRFQNELTQIAYDALGHAYKANDNEVAMVTRLVNAINGKSYGQVTVAANKIHGTRSYVGFNYRDKPTTKELGDMAVIAMVTAGRERLLQRVCIIQNKKAKDHVFRVDNEQLFLLKNFPPFSGSLGLFRGMTDVAFHNRSGCLGAYGIFDEPGEMMFIAAPLFAEVLRYRSSIQLADIGLPSVINHYDTQLTFPIAPLVNLHPDEWYMIMRELFHHLSPFHWPGFGIGLPFFGNVHFGRDLYDFIRAWTQINLGEYTCVGNNIVNNELDSFTNRLLRDAGLGSGIDMPGTNDEPEKKPEGDMSVFLFRIDVEHKE